MEILVGSSPPRAVPDGSQFVPTDALPYPTCGGSLPVSRFHQLHIARHDKKGLDVTALEEQIEIARRQIVSDGYAMSVGELISLYKEKELIINPSYQRLFRWEESQKTRFIESLLLGIPIPPIFVFQKADGVWELIDGLQRTSTILEFAGALVDPDGQPVPPSELEGTNLLPALAGVHWNARGESDTKSLTTTQQLDMKRTRIRVEILKKESDEDAKFELFQRLNTGGSKLSEQEVRNCVLVMVNPDFYEWITDLVTLDDFGATVSLTENARSQQKHIEIALRHIAYRRVPFQAGLNVNEYLDKAALHLAKHMSADERATEETVFRGSFALLAAALGENAFKRWDGERHSGSFLISGFDAIAHGVASNLVAINSLNDPRAWVREKARATWSEEVFQRHSGMGVRGTTRLMNLLPFGVEFFRPDHE